jgi:Concanavalin A-like lectin/glucanases superfamily
MALSLLDHSLQYAWPRAHAVRWFLALSCLWLGNARAQGQPIMDGLTLWLQADVGVTSDCLGLVSTWSDQSGMGNDATQADPTSSPLFVDGVLNGKPVITFDGQHNFLSVAGPILTSQQFSILAVVNDTRDPSDNRFREIISNWDPANTLPSVFFGTVNGNPVRARLTDNFGGFDPPYNQQGAGTITDPTTHFIFTGVSGAMDAMIYQNTASIADKGSTLTPRDFSTPFVVGRQGSANNEYWQGDIAELLVYDRELSADELTQNWSYLQQKYFPAPSGP